MGISRKKKEGNLHLLPYFVWRGRKNRGITCEKQHVFSSGIVPPVGGRRSGCLCLSLTVRPKKSNQAGGRSLSENVSYCHE